MNEFEVFEERVFHRERLQGAILDFRGRTCFQRYDCCEFVKPMIFIEETTQSLAFTNCVFEDCNIDRLEPNESKSLVARDNIFKAPIEQRRSEFEKAVGWTLWRKGRMASDYRSRQRPGRLWFVVKLVANSSGDHSN